MRIHIFQHVPFEGIGSMESWLLQRKAAVTTTRFFAGDDCSKAHNADVLIILGGPMSVHDEAEFPWLVREKAAIALALQRKIPMLGICLGAQLIAHVAGANVYPNPQKEIGWWPIEPAASKLPATGFTFHPLNVFHWHGETFELPPDSIHLASSAACRNQAFALPNRVIGIQFHLETTRDSARDIITHARHEIIPAPFVQDEPTLLSTPEKHYLAINREMNRLLDFLADGIQ